MTVSDMAIGINNNINSYGLVANPYGTIDLKQVPIKVIRPECRQLLCKQLNGTKVLLSEEGLQRDWRGILQCLNLNHTTSSDFISHKDPFGRIFERWLQEQGDSASLDDFQTILGRIDRWDVLDETCDYFVQYAKEYISNRIREQQTQQQTQLENNQIDKFNFLIEPTTNCDQKVLTYDDQKLVLQGLSPQQYDAFLLFADEDIDFATEIIENLETNNVKLCSKDRDIIGGEFVLDTVQHLIGDRCDRLIVILSPAFFRSESNKFFVKFVQAMSIEERRRKVIPVLYEPCDVDNHEAIRFLSCLNYLRLKRYGLFWQNLCLSVKMTPFTDAPAVSPSINLPRIEITEVDSPFATQCQNSQLPKSKRGIHNGIDKTVAIDSGYYKAPKRKDKQNNGILQRQNTSSFRSTETSTPTALKRFWPSSPKLRTTTSLWTLAVDNNQSLDKENDRCRSTISLTSPTSSPTGLHYKKPKWYKKLLSPNSGSSSSIKPSTESDSAESTDKVRKKKKWYRKRFTSKSRRRDTKAHEV